MSDVQTGALPTLRAEAPLTVGTEGRAPVTIAEILHHAIDRNVPVEALEKLVALHERISDREARKEFHEALTRFQQECPPIVKNRTAKIATRSGTGYSYTYAELDKVCATVNPILARNGLSYTWDSEFGPNSAVVTFVLRHVSGHEERNSVKLPVDNKSAMSDQQMVGAALSFGKRLSLLAGLGLSTAEEDLDGRTGSGVQTISGEQADNLEALAEEVKVDKKRLLKWLGVSKFTDTPVTKYDEAIANLEKQRVKP